MFLHCFYNRYTYKFLISNAPLYLHISFSQCVVVDLYLLNDDMEFVSTLRKWREYAEVAHPFGNTLSFGIYWRIDDGFVSPF